MTVKRNVTDAETERVYDDKWWNEHASVVSDYIISDVFSDGVVKEVSAEQIKKYFSDHQTYQKELEKLALYYYISNGDVFQLLDAAKVLPTLNYKISVFSKPSSHEKNHALIQKTLHKTKHKKLTRDILSQSTSSGTLVGMWLGDKKSPFFYIFENLSRVYPHHRKNGGWVVAFDLQWLKEMKEHEREVMFDNFDPYITKEMYDSYLADKKNKRLVFLPQERTSVVRTHTLKQSQRYGLSWITQGLYDIQHKKKLKDLEKAVANNFINAVAVLTIGSKEDEETRNLKLNKNLKKTIHTRVKQALEKNQSNGVTVITLPEFADLRFPELKGDALEAKKFESINTDIDSAYGVSSAVKSGNSGNFASAKINLEMLYNKIGVLLEEIESEVYQKLLNLILPASQADNYYLEYEKGMPLTKDKILETLIKLNDKGFALKPILDITGQDFESYINQTMYETEELKLQERVAPYRSTHTSSGDKKTSADADNENTNKSKTNDGNNLPDE